MSAVYFPSVSCVVVVVVVTAMLVEDGRINSGATKKERKKEVPSTGIEPVTFRYQ